MQILGIGHRGRVHATVVLLLFASMATVSAQVVLPPMNFGGTSIVDGMSGPGILFEPVIVEGYFAHHFEDANGTRIPGANTVESWSNLFHVAYISQHRILGGFYGAEVLVPVAHLNIETDFGPRGEATGWEIFSLAHSSCHGPAIRSFTTPIFPALRCSRGCRRVSTAPREPSISVATNMASPRTMRLRSS